MSLPIKASGQLSDQSVSQSLTQSLSHVVYQSISRWYSLSTSNLHLEGMR